MFKNLKNLHAAAPPDIQKLVDDSITSGRWSDPLDRPDSPDVLEWLFAVDFGCPAPDDPEEKLRLVEEARLAERFGCYPVDFGSHRSNPLAFAWVTACWGAKKQELIFAAATLEQRRMVMRECNRVPELRGFIAAHLQKLALTLVHDKYEKEAKRGWRQ